MKFIVDSAVLNKALKTLSPAIKQNVVIPILSSVLIDVKASEARITATDLSLTITQTIPCESAKEFKWVLPFKELMNISSVIGAQPVTIEIGKQVLLTAMSGEKHQIGIAIDDVKNFPIVEEFEPEIEYDADEEFLYQLQMASNCVGEDELRPEFHGVCVERTKDYIRLFSTDTFQCYCFDAPQKSTQIHRVAIGTGFIKAIKSIKCGKISVGKKFIKIISNGITVVGRLTEHKYPDCSMFFNEYTHNCEVSNRDLMSAINNMLAHSSDFYTSTLNFTKQNVIHVSFDDVINHQHFEKEIDAPHSVETPAIRFNATILKNLLSLVPESETIKMSIIDERKLVHIDPENKAVKLMIAPIYLQSQ